MYQAARLGVDNSRAPPGTRDAPGLGQNGIGVDEMLDELAHDDDVDARSAEGEPRVLDRAPHHLEAVPPGLVESRHRPVETDDRDVDARPPGAGRRGGGPRPLAATHVHGPEGTVRVRGEVDQHLGLELGAGGPGDERRGGILVELLQRVRGHRGAPPARCCRPPVATAVSVTCPPSPWVGV